MNSKIFDIIIIGGGPAGTTAALKLSQSDLKVALIDKAVFPRDKVCGDAVPGPSFKVLDSISKDWGKAMNQFSKSQNITASKIVAPNNKSFTIHWKTMSYNSKRVDFDNFLFQLVKEKTQTEIFEGVKINSIKSNPNSVRISGFNSEKEEVILKSKLIIGADGTNGITAKILANFEMNKNHHCAAVRAYATGISELEKTTNEFYLIQKYSPGYFWIFPLGYDSANIGFGMLSSKISEKRLSLKKVLKEIISTHLHLKNRFEKAEISGGIKGFGLPLGSRFAKLSGDRFMLTGDAGSLIDPLQGHGIDKAMLSGKLAAEQAIRCFEMNNFSADFLKNYDREVYRKLGSEFKRNYWALKLFTRFPLALNIITQFAQNQSIKSFLQKFT